MHQSISPFGRKSKHGGSVSSSYRPDLNDLVDCFTWGLHEAWFSFESHCLVSSDLDSGLHLPNNLSVCSLPLPFLISLSYGIFFGFEPSWLAIAASSVRLQGFLDAIAYGLTERVIYRWIKFFQYWFCYTSEPPSRISPSHDASSSQLPPSDPSLDSSILFTEGYLWERLVPHDIPASNHSSISDSAYYTPLTSKDLPIISRDRGYLFNPLEDKKNYPYQYLYQQQV